MTSGGTKIVVGDHAVTEHVASYSVTWIGVVVVVAALVVLAFYLVRRTRRS